MVIKSTTYTGMNLKGEIRESISLDEDDISDVEDEVFIRDGKNGYKFAEELNVKRPLMAPRRKHGKYDLGTRLKPRPPCRAWCKPCCYVLIALSVLIGLIVLVVVLVSIYPLPLDKLKDWIISKEKKAQKSDGHLPCTNLRVTDVWAVNLPGLTTDSPVRTLDINKDGIEDVVFGFGVGENYNIFPPDIFCPIFMGVSTPCDGGILAMNGKDGTILWKLWLNDTIFSLHCTVDVNLDGTEDCLAVGVDGTLGIFDSKTGNQIWKLNTGKMNVFVANFIEDQDGDNISDVITSHSSLEDKSGGHIMLLSGKTGHELKRANIPNKSKTFFMPQVYKQNETSTIVLFGSGSPNAAGNLSYVRLNNLANLENGSTTIYEDKFKGILTQAVLVDLSGDKVLDIVSSVYNSTIIAINGKTLKTIWNYTVANAVTDMSPTPALFNCDNITDFLVVYQKYDNIFNYNYTETLIIDGATGKPIYPPINGGIITQLNGLTLSMEGEGHDIYLLWTNECANMDQNSNSNSNNGHLEDKPKVYDECKKLFNTSTILKLNGLNEYHQPPGITIYNSALKSDFEHSNIKSVTKRLKEYLQTHPNPNLNYKELEGGESEVYENYNAPHGQVSRKYDKSSFRHKDRPNGAIKDFEVPETSSNLNGGGQIPIPEDARISEQSLPDYKTWISNQDYIDPEFSNYNLGDDNIPYNQKQMLYDEVAPKVDAGNRDPRSKVKNALNLKDPTQNTKTQKKNLSDKIYGYHNIRLAKNRLLRDEESLPTDILKDTYFKNEENRLRKTKLEQRDVNSHVVGEMEDSDINMMLEEQKRDALQNRSTTLWDIETESELLEREDRGFVRRKRDVSRLAWESVNKVTSVGAVLESFNISNSSNTIDVVFVKYWHPTELSLETVMARDIEECIQEKIQQLAKPTVLTDEQKIIYEKQCQEEQDNLRGDFVYFNQLALLRLGQMTVYRIRIQCDCDSTYDKKIKEKCAQFLPKRLQAWPQYLGRNGDGIFGR